MNLQNELERLGKTRWDIFLELRKFMRITEVQFYGALSGRSHSHTARRICKQVNIQIMLWNYYKLNGRTI